MAGERALGERFARAGETLQDRRAAKHAAEERRKQQNLRDIAALCSKLEGLSGSEVPSRRGVERLLQEAAEALSRLGPLPSLENPDIWRQRLSAAHEGLSRRLGEYEDAEQWRLWSNAQAQERLIQRAEELLACSDLRRVLKEVAELQQAWEPVAAAPRDQSQALWDRFRTARDELRRRGGEYLADNLKKKQALCEEVERRAESSDWERTAADIRRLQAEWKQIGPVLQRHSKPLWARFRAPCNRFFERREAQREAMGKERQTNAAAKAALCEKAEALADSTDWEEAAAEIKRLQAEWKQIGPVPRDQSRRSGIASAPRATGSSGATGAATSWCSKRRQPGPSRSCTSCSSSARRSGAVQRSIRPVSPGGSVNCWPRGAGSAPCLRGAPGN